MDWLARHRSKGVLVDTNLLLLSIVGGFEPGLIATFKRTSRFTEEDYRTLERFLSQFHRIFTTPNILTELSNLSGQMKGNPGEELFRSIASVVQVLKEEHFSSSAEACQTNEFLSMGLTDAVIAKASADGVLVLTDDFRLAQFLMSRGNDVINFNHLRNLL